MVSDLFIKVLWITIPFSLYMILSGIIGIIRRETNMRNLFWGIMTAPLGLIGLLTYSAVSFGNPKETGHMAVRAGLTCIIVGLTVVSVLGLMAFFGTYFPHMDDYYANMIVGSPLLFGAISVALVAFVPWNSPKV
jgi:hypothetical protein